MESGCRLGAGDPAPAIERPGIQPGPTARVSISRSAFTYSAPSAALGGGQAMETQSRTAFKSQIPQRSKEMELHKALNSTDPENELNKTTRQRQMKTMDPAKKNIRKSYRPLSRQKAEEELKEKNQLLEAVNKQLYLKLTESQEELKVLTQKVELLEESQDSYLAILESGNIDPVTGKQILENHQETMKCQKDSVLLLESLKDELKLFNQTATKQMEELQALKVKLKVEEEKRSHFLEKQAAFNNKKDDLTATLKQMEQLLAL
ncbi:small kinetochore-associated protein [Monodelphis domestica]|uniref:Kinetochore localized astrin (SPAG5) binding protein n=1 Tax=Monodelphis domestica TaxID=13616 RepID=A0A5F8GK51_MONDO|nr:small kinetochore-associated protein [Monodelphis domestica]